MKKPLFFNNKYIFAILFFICSFISVYSASDTLMITLKNNQIDKISITDIQKIRFENITAVDEQNLPAKALDLIGNTPNPFHDNTSIEFEINTTGNLMIFIYDNNAELINILECHNCPPGKNSILWDCLNIQNKRVNSGLYHYEVRFNEQVQSKNMILVR